MAKRAKAGSGKEKAPAKGKPSSRGKSTVKSGSSRSTPKRGYFITLEGGEGSGKSTQMKRLAAFFREVGHDVVMTREPGGSPGAEAVRHVLLSGAAEPLGEDMEAILFAAARGDHVDRVIEPALQRGDIVISDRFYDSTRVYQGASGRVDDQFVRRLERIACGDTWPDLTVIIDLDPEEGMRRAGTRRKSDEAPDRFEKESLKQQQIRRDAYLKIAAEEPQRCVVIDGEGSENAVFERLKSVVVERMGNKALLTKSKVTTSRKTTASKKRATGTESSKPASGKKPAARSKHASGSASSKGRAARTPENAGST